MCVRACARARACVRACAALRCAALHACVFVCVCACVRAWQCLSLSLSHFECVDRRGLDERGADNRKEAFRKKCFEFQRFMDKEMSRTWATAKFNFEFLLARCRCQNEFFKRRNKTHDEKLGGL